MTAVNPLNSHLPYKEREKIRLRNRMKAVWQTNREAGLCGKCDNIPEINPKTGKRYSECEKHRTNTKRRNKNRYGRRNQK